ncbi:glycosyltransferase family 61 protein [Hymenobacter volaticus]|uniref:Glycosyltransferase family 61 protein n=1 Tax=Hymenobacter volaticus TaxID=2932254 RepID=A0ABY4G8X2_9BACT|nr:glycosyltransferase family 61 protein [Hymenobacter volaticus]UOQ67220.1 glycosyltransferase family 61 protein [Hymenobacter volaticus]
MASASSYQFIKTTLDYLFRKIAELLPDWQQYQIDEVMPAAAPYQPTLPANISALPAALAAAFKQQITYKPHAVYTLDKVNISWDGSVFKNLRVFIPSLVQAKFVRRLQDTFLLRQWLGQHVALPDSEVGIAVVHDEWSVGNYYHWLVDSLPRLLVLREKYPNYLLLIPDFLPPKNTPDYIKISAAILGFEKYFPVNTRQIVKAKHVVLPELTAESLFQNPILIQRVRTELIGALGSGNTEPKKRVYASRATQSVRRVINENEVITLLEGYGFEIVLFENLSFVQQVQLMQQTAVFMGVHGAGMTNLLFLPSNARIVELLNQESGDLCYFRLASCCALSYFCVPCQATDTSALNQSDLLVDINQLKQTIEAVI